MPTFVQDVVHYQTPLLVAGALAATVLAAVLGRWLLRRLPNGTPWFYYLASLGGLAVSLNTSWRFFGERLHIVGAERIVMFSVLELALIACALGMRANVRRIDPITGRPGPAGAPRMVAWALCGLSAYAALLLSGPVDGAARVLLGPTLSLVMLHLALGIEIRRAGARTGTWARVVGELRERALSRFGLADDERNAVTRTRERAASRAARLALSRRAPWRSTRLARALRAAHIAHDPQLREHMLAELAVLRAAGQLAGLDQDSPWQPTVPDEVPVLDLTVPDEAPVLHPPASDDTLAAGQLAGVILTANADDTGRSWAAEPTKNAAIDRADALLPDCTHRQLVAALASVDITVAESSVRRRRSTRPRAAVR